MSRIVTMDELNPDHGRLILNQLKCIKDTVSICIDRSIDDYDNLIGLLSRAVSDSFGYDKEEIIASINEQFE